MSNSIEDLDLLRAVGAWAGQMALAAQTQSLAFAALARAITPAQAWSPVSELPAQDRPARQALFLAALKLRTDTSVDGRIPMEECLELAKYFGYDGRGTAGFYRRSADGSPGLLVRHDDTVELGAAGLDRIREYDAFVVDNALRIEASRTLL